jgi:membrane-associated phospholipid phosphatase
MTLGGRAALPRLVRTLKAKLESALHMTPAQSVRGWAQLAMAGVLAVMSALYVAIALLGALGERGSHFLWEEAWLLMFETSPISFSTAVWLQTLGTDFTLLIVVMTTVGIAIWNQRPLLAISIVMSLIVMDAAVRIGWFSLERARPDIIAQGIASPGFHSFPSGHTAKTVAIYGLLASEWFKASGSAIERMIIIILALLIALVVPFGRMRMGVHWPTDILGGYLIATVWLCFIVAGLRHERSAVPQP